MALRLTSKKAPPAPVVSQVDWVATGTSAKSDYRGNAFPVRSTMERSMLAYSLAHGPTLTPLIERTIGDVFDAAVEKWPAREAVVSRHERERYSYRALQVEV